MQDDTQPRVLVVDDDDAARRMMRRALTRRGFQVDERSDGASGLACIREERPDIVLLDLRMPGELSGLDVVRTAKSDPATRDVPIIIVSASVHADARVLTETSGCDAFIEKPVEFDTLERAMRELLDR